MRLSWLALFLLCLCASCFVDRPVSQLAHDGIELRKVQAYEPPFSDPSALVAAPGDFVLTGLGMRVVIGGMRRELESRGAILEATFAGFSSADSIALLAPRVYVGGVARPLRVERMFILERAGAPVLRLEGAVLLRDRVIQLARELALGRTPGTLTMTTRLVTFELAGEKDVRLGARIASGGPLPFLPGIGELNDETWHRAPWFGTEGATGSACFGYMHGGLAVRAFFERSSITAFLLYSEVTQAHGFVLASARPHYEKSVLTLSPSGMARAVRAFGAWRARAYPEAWAYLPNRPQGSVVELRDREDRLLVRGRPDEAGRVVLPVFALEGTKPGFSAIASAYGHAPSDPFVSENSRVAPFALLIPNGGRIRVRARESDGDTPISARVRITALDQAPPLSLGPDYRASGAGDTVIALAGDTGVDVPPGRYHVVVTHGPEWSLSEQDVEVSETFSPRVEAQLEHQVDASSWVACDLHLHAAPSPDSEVTLEDRIATLAAEGVSFAVATDHNHVTDYAPVAHMMSLDSLRTVTGVEVTTWDPHIGHFNAYPFPLDPNRPDNGAPDRVQPEPAALFKLLHAVSPEIVVQVNHPRSSGGIGYFDVMHYDSETGAADPRFSADFDALEVYNGFDLADAPKLEQVFNDYLNILARGQRVAATGSSDSHQVRYQLAGYPRTYALVPPEAGTDPAAVVRAVKAGASFVTTGPFVEVSIFGGGPGSMVEARDGQVTLSVRVQAPTWMDVNQLEVFVGKEKVLTREIVAPKPQGKHKGKPIVRLDVEDITLPVKQDSFVIVRITGNTSNDSFFGRLNIAPHAFTNPIFVDADGDGDTPWTRISPRSTGPG